MGEEKELEWTYEIKFVGGEEGEALERAQARAVMEILEWIHRQSPEAT